jgi:hypothetical protein
MIMIINLVLKVTQGFQTVKPFYDISQLLHAAIPQAAQRLDRDGMCNVA